uniref:Uncharacterized protein n=1 Tax=Romanomermis culicivorax TaxID=13658 RepID=A0A915KNF7_ROMCU
MLEPTAHSDDFKVATTASDPDLTNHEPAMLNKSLPCHTNKQKLDFTLNRMTQALAKLRPFQPPGGQTYIYQQTDSQHRHQHSKADIRPLLLRCNATKAHRTPTYPRHAPQ